MCADGEGIEIHYRPGSLRSLHYLDRCPWQAARLAMLAAAGARPFELGDEQRELEAEAELRKMAPPNDRTVLIFCARKGGRVVGRPGHTAVSSSLSFSSSSSRARCNRCQPLREQARRISAGPCRVEGHRREEGPGSTPARAARRDEGWGGVPPGRRHRIHTGPCRAEGCRREREDREAPLG